VNISPTLCESYHGLMLNRTIFPIGAGWGSCAVDFVQRCSGNCSRVTTSGSHSLDSVEVTGLLDVCSSVGIMAVYRVYGCFVVIPR
jgi:hypothetical protein